MRRIVLGYPDIPALSDMQKLSGDERNDVYLARGAGERWVVRVIRPDITLEGVRYAHRGSRFAARHIPEVNAPLLTAAGDTLFTQEGMIVCLHPFADGVHGCREREAHRDAAADRQARLHRAGRLCPDHSPRPDRPRLLEMDFKRDGMYDWRNVERMPRDGGRARFEDANHQRAKDQADIRRIYDMRQEFFRGPGEV